MVFFAFLEPWGLLWLQPLTQCLCWGSGCGMCSGNCRAVQLHHHCWWTARLRPWQHAQVFPCLQQQPCGILPGAVNGFVFYLAEFSGRGLLA